MIESAKGGYWVRTEDRSTLRPEWFGAVGDGRTDDRAALQKTLDMAQKYGSTVRLRSRYAIKSTHPEEPAFGILARSGVNVYGGTIVLQTQADHLWGAPGRVDNFEYKGLRLNANRKAQTALYLNGTFCPYITLQNCDFFDATEHAALITTFVASLDRCRFFGSKRGLSIVGKGEDYAGELACTSTTIRNCYAVNCEEVGFNFGWIDYSTMLACAADHITGVAYRFRRAHGVTFQGGAEHVHRYLEVTDGRSLEILPGKVLRCGMTSADKPSYPQKPPEQFIRLNVCASVTLNDIIFASAASKPSKGVVYATGSGSKIHYRGSALRADSFRTTSGVNVIGDFN